MKKEYDVFDITKILFFQQITTDGRGCKIEFEMSLI